MRNQIEGRAKIDRSQIFILSSVEHKEARHFRDGKV